MKDTEKAEKSKEKEKGKKTGKPKAEKKKNPHTRTWVAGLALFKFCAISLYLLGDSLVDILNRFHQMFGAVSWLFAILMIALLAEILHLLLFRSCNHKNLEFIEVASPPVGLLGTVFALMNGFTDLNLVGMKLEDAITVIVLAIAVSLKTTAAGIINSLIAMVVRERLSPILHRDEKKVTQKEERNKNAKETMDTSDVADNNGVVVV